ncbi:hypothetical protein L249_4478, partial [Ophiocordyceps polyrhachis-furcata BCC 54312]
PKARHNALSHSRAIAVIAPESTRYSDRHSDRRAHPINLGTRQPLHRSARCTNSGHSARLVVTAVITVIVTAIDALGLEQT